MIYIYIKILLYVYIEKKKVINIEGQLRGFQGSGHPKTCALHFSTPWVFLYEFKIRTVFAPLGAQAKTPALCQLC